MTLNIDDFHYKAMLTASRRGLCQNKINSKRDAGFNYSNNTSMLVSRDMLCSC